MPQKRTNKEQRLHKTFNPFFTNASTFYHSQKIPEITTSIQDTLNPSSSSQISEIQEKLNFYRQKAMEITDSKLIEQQVYEYITQMTKKTSGEYKANSIKQAVDAINRYLQVQEILADDFLNPNTSEGLLYRINFNFYLMVVYFIAVIIAKTISIKLKDEAAQNIHLLPNSESANVIKKYLSKRLSGNFMKDIGKSIKVELPFGLLTNHSGHKIVVQILQDAIPEDAIMGVTDHKSI
ncbi:3114_t:CDS:2 [Funneliformis mosseae]|uniref:3114_t:CDS:1 n=1 Tax=Funneliformis mosseae TaxID=27381 RepID=A0A9N9GBX6_FUNMO|nr:3114_t:CDS:2 [Funneliformis mosseae]